MSPEHLFDVVFEGRPLSGIPLEEAIKALAVLSRKSTNEIAALFNDRL